MKKATVSILLLFILTAFNTSAQLLKDTVTLRMMCSGVDLIYNMQFDEARTIYKRIVAKYPEHPVLYVYKGLMMYWEHFPITPYSPEKESFEKEMLRAIEDIEKRPDHESDPELLLGNISARGLLLLFYADNDLTRDVISMASSTYQYVKEAFNHTNSYADFYFITGLYNYYREAYPEAHPVYKPIAMLFPKGDKTKGLREIQIASKEAIVLKAEAYSFLSGIYISFENNFQQAYKFSKALHDLYPKNMQYLAMYVKNLLLVKRYSEAENLVKANMDKNPNRFFQAQLSILNGIVLEKLHHNNKQAEYYYEKGIRDIESYGTFGNEYAAYAYHGLSRLTSDKHQKKTYRKKALDLSDFENVNFD
ncbi:MAG TPA: hypothetical protein VHI78_06910 [Bacteroidales bacterium]|nr:hypothetical protein [Bacteroidales bacterium]